MSMLIKKKELILFIKTIGWLKLHFLTVEIKFLKIQSLSYCNKTLIQTKNFMYKLIFLEIDYNYWKLYKIKESDRHGIYKYIFLC